MNYFAGQQCWHHKLGGGLFRTVKIVSSGALIKAERMESTLDWFVFNTRTQVADAILNVNLVDPELGHQSQRGVRSLNSDARRPSKPC